MFAHICEQTLKWLGAPSWHRDNWFFAQNRVMFCAMEHRAGWIREKAATSLNPSQVETTLAQLNEQWPP